MVNVKLKSVIALIISVIMLFSLTDVCFADGTGEEVILKSEFYGVKVSSDPNTFEITRTGETTSSGIKYNYAVFNVNYKIIYLDNETKEELKNESGSFSMGAETPIKYFEVGTTAKGFSRDHVLVTMTISVTSTNPDVNIFTLGYTSASIKIDNQQLRKARFNVDTGLVFEPDSLVKNAYSTITNFISLDKGTETEIKLNYSITGTATNGVDYEKLTGEAVVPANNLLVEIPIKTIKDGLAEDDETIILTLLPGDGYIIDKPSQIVITIYGDNASNPDSSQGVSNQVGSGDENGSSAPPTVKLEVLDTKVSEKGKNQDKFHIDNIDPGENKVPDDLPGTGKFLVTRSGDISKPLKVYYLVGGSAVNGKNYMKITDFVIIPANEEKAVVTINPIDDGAAKGNKKVKITLANAATDSENNTDPQSTEDAYKIESEHSKAVMTIIDNKTQEWTYGETVTQRGYFSLNFNIGVSESSYTSNIKILDSNNKPVPIKITLKEENKAVVIDPAGDGFQKGKVYTLVINRKLKSTSGATLNTTYKMKFKT